MSKQKKKRNKPYQGAGASASRPTVTRISAANRSTVSQWWFEKKRFVKPVLIALAVAIVIAWLLFELVRVASGSGA